MVYVTVTVDNPLGTLTVCLLFTSHRGQSWNTSRTDQLSKTSPYLQLTSAIHHVFAALWIVIYAVGSLWLTQNANEEQREEKPRERQKKENK